MKKLHQLGFIGGTILCMSAWGTMALSNPATLPDHPGHPMKPLESPVTGQSLANDPGKSSYYGQDALKNSTKEGNEDLKILSDMAQEVGVKKEGMDISTDSKDLKGHR